MISIKTGSNSFSFCIVQTHYSRLHCANTKGQIITTLFGIYIKKKITLSFLKVIISYKLSFLHHSQTKINSFKINSFTINFFNISW